MEINKSLTGVFGVAQWHVPVPVPILIIVGPLLGLVYIIVLPFIGAAALVLASGYRTTQGLPIMRRRTS